MKFKKAKQILLDKILLIILKGVRDQNIMYIGLMEDTEK
jgi:hypothetical protein